MNQQELRFLLSPPVTFHRSFVPIADGVIGALFLSWVYQRSKGEWIRNVSTEECEQETGLSVTEQAAAIQELKDKGLLFYQTIEGLIYVRIDKQQLFKLVAYVAS